MSKENMKSIVTVEDIKVTLYIWGSTSQVNDEPPLLHTHMYTEMFACTKGKIHIAADGDFIELKEGDLVIAPIGARHCKINSGEDSEWRGIAFLVQHCYTKSGNPSLWKKLFSICVGTKPEVFRGVLGLCSQINEIYNSTLQESHIPALKLAVVLSELAEMRQSDDASGLYNAADSPDIERSMLLERFIECNYTKNISLDELAGILYISRRQLSRIIKKQYGASLRSVLDEKRLDMSAHLLKTTEYTIDEICGQTGFVCASSSFYKKFGERFGMTPTEYRRRKV